MSGNGTVVMGERGRIVIPQDIRERLGFTTGTPLLLVEAEGGLVLLTREQLRERLRVGLEGKPSMVDDLLADRRAAALAEGG